MAGKETWQSPQKEIFNELKFRLIKEPVLTPYSDKYTNRVTTDTSNDAVEQFAKY